MCGTGLLLEPADPAEGALSPRTKQRLLLETQRLLQMHVRLVDSGTCKLCLGQPSAKAPYEVPIVVDLEVPVVVDPGIPDDLALANFAASQMQLQMPLANVRPRFDHCSSLGRLTVATCNDGVFVVRGWRHTSWDDKQSSSGMFVSRLSFAP